MSAQATFDARLDGPRCGTLLADTVRALEGGLRLTLGEIRGVIGHGSEAGISARIREARSLGYRIEKARRGAGERGLWEYWLVAPVEAVKPGEQLRLIAESRWEYE